MVKTTSENNQKPFHLSISEQLRQQIFNGEYLPGEQLPSEHKLMLHFEVSRITVRRAIANLANQGLVVSQRGRGVFVTEEKKVSRSLSNPLTFFDEDMANQGISCSIQSISYELLRPPRNISQKLSISKQKQVYCQKKVLFTEQVPVAVDITYLLDEIGQAFASQLQSNLIYPTLDKNGVSIEKVEATLECIHATPEASEYLEISLGAPLLVNHYTAYTSNEKPIICGETISRADRLCYSLVLTKNSST